MKLLGIKKLFVSLGLGAMLMFGTAAAVSAATVGTLEQFTEPEEAEPIVLSDDNMVDVPVAYLGDSTFKAVQTAATTSTISLQWKAVSGATSYEVAIGPYKNRDDAKFKKFKPITSTACKISGNDLKPGMAYTVRIRARNASEATDYIYPTCFTLYDKVKVSGTSYKNDIFTIKLAPTTKYNYISGYHVYYHDYGTGKTFSRYYSGRYDFSVKPAANKFYRAFIRPYVMLNGKKYICPGSTVQYLAQQPKLTKKGYTSNTMTIGWNKVAGATSYTVYIKYPGKNTYTKVKTTGALTYKVTGMKPNQDYFIKVIANKGSAHSPNTQYYRMRLTKK